MIKAYLKGIVRNGGKGKLGVGIELFRLDAVADTDVELTDSEEEVADESKNKSETAIVRIYEEIGENFWTGEGISVKNFAKQLDELGDIKSLNIHVNCLGGDCFTAQALYNLIQDHPSESTAYIDGVAASAATIICSAADKVIARNNTNYMVHYPWTIVMGNATALNKAAEDLDKLTVPIVNVYKGQVNGKITEHKIRALMEAETWMTASEARDYGFVDQVKGKIKEIAKASANQIFCSGKLLDVRKYHYRNVPNYPTVNKEEIKIENKGKKLMTKDELKTAHPELYNEIGAEARTAEQARLAALDKMLAPGLEDVITKAKADGKQPNEIAMECLEIVKTGNASTNQINNMKKDGQAANNVGAGDAPMVAPKKGVNTKAVSALSAAFANGPRGARQVATNGSK